MEIRRRAAVVRRRLGGSRHFARCRGSFSRLGESWCWCSPRCDELFHFWSLTVCSRPISNPESRTNRDGRRAKCKVVDCSRVSSFRLLQSPVTPDQVVGRTVVFHTCPAFGAFARVNCVRSRLSGRARARVKFFRPPASSQSRKPPTNGLALSPARQ